ncbi:MAG: type V CRISPR-associated protein Cas12a/Cpf1 [Lachnospirales bacterium]
MEKSLSDGKLSRVTEFYEIYNSYEKNEKKFDKVKTDLRKEVIDCVKLQKEYEHLFKKELITKLLPDIYDGDKEKLELINKFKKFTTYFTGFNENRENMYSDQEISTSIAYRIVHQNLPKYIDNLKIFNNLVLLKLNDEIRTLENDFDFFLVKKRLKDYFELEGFNSVLNQSGIDKYNQILGGYSLENGKKVQGLNEYINLYNQKVDKKERIPKLKPLYKQILSDSISLSFIQDNFESFDEVIESVNTFNIYLKNNVINPVNRNGIKEFYKNIKEYDLSKVYIKNDLSITEVSKKVYGDWQTINKGISYSYDENYNGKKRFNTKSYDDEKEKNLKKEKSYSIKFLNNCVEKYSLEVLEESSENICDYFINFKNLDKCFIDIINDNYTELQRQIENCDNLSKNKDVIIDKIKLYLDSVKDLQRFIKLLSGSDDEAEKDESFYFELSSLLNNIDTVTPLYNKVRNFATKKNYSKEKIKLNFNNSTLLAGWDLNKEKDNTCTLLKKDDLYYLCIMDKNHRDVMSEDFEVSSENSYEKMMYKLLPGANKMLPKVFLSKKGKDEYNPSNELLEKYAMGTHKKGSNFNIEDCHNLIDYFKYCISKHKDYKNFDFNFSDTDTYEDLSFFYKEVESQGYKVNFRHIPEDYINSLIDEGKIYLFKIYNKDFSPYSKGTPNLHTLYWKMLFDDRNLNDVVYKLNGEAEMFYRKKSISLERPTHPKNESIKNKNALNPKSESVFDYDIIKDRRYTVDKFQFHVPIALNFKAIGESNINKSVNTMLKYTDEDVYVIGIDRGERHLLYVSVINPKGEIVKQESFNIIENQFNNTTYKVDYHKLLDEKEKGRDVARKNWKNIENIKELKEGYLSQVIHKITDLMKEYNAIIVLEDLNFGFKNGRFKVEKQVYQKFEKMLISKLNYMVDKKEYPEAKGGLLNAYQLSNQFESFKKLGKQSGFLYYVPAWNTSKIDPTTGFVNFLYLKYESVDASKKLVSNFDSIGYNEQEKIYEFDIDYSKFTKKAEGTKEKWTICSYDTRVLTYRDKDNNSMWTSKEVNLTEEFDNLFEKFKVDVLPKGKDFKDEILSQTTKEFYKEFINLLKLTLQMRNSVTGTDIDYLVSPVKNSNGKFYDSRKADASLPIDADANGAYNIARKGLWVIDKIRNTEDESLGKVKLAMSNKEWLAFAQKQ